jgi:Amidohydrolase family
MATPGPPRRLSVRNHSCGCSGSPRSGLLAEGYDADLITVDGDPLADISLLAEPNHITAVWSADARSKTVSESVMATRGCWLGNLDRITI